MGRRLTLRCFIPILCGVYFITIYIFHGRLQYEMSADDDESLANSYFYSKHGILKNGNVVELKRKVLQSAQNGHGSADNISHLAHIIKDKSRSAGSKGQRGSDTRQDRYDHKCFLPAQYSKRNFTALEQSVYLYSAYLDERYGDRIIRIMSVLALEKKERILELSCHFSVNGTHYIKKATMYELCENHGKKYGGFIWSCNVPSMSINVCHVNVSLSIISVSRKYKLRETRSVIMPVTKLKPEQTRFKYSICVPPLFGNIDTYKFIEFIELNRIFGADHFIFYNFDISNNDVLKLLDHYSRKELVTLIDWKLPSVILKNQIWYNGQLSAHNDCLYRAMSLTDYLAIIDIDEYIVPHNNRETFSESFGDLFQPDICGLSFDSAFYDPKFTNKTGKTKTGLVTIDLTGRSLLYSKVRTKVMVQPTKIFEVGIHHISKPASESLKVLKVNTSTAYLHHYRNCVPNYGMKCGIMKNDETLLPLENKLQKAVESIKTEVLNELEE